MNKDNVCEFCNLIADQEPGKNRKENTTKPGKTFVAKKKRVEAVRRSTFSVVKHSPLFTLEEIKKIPKHTNQQL